MGVASWLLKGDCGIEGKGTISFAIAWIGISGVSNGDERAVGADECIGEGASAGIIIAEETTVEPK